jgi:uncharacterized membrane protein YtjA (UPF0391 family)
MLSWSFKFLMAATLAAIIASSEVAPGAVLLAKLAVAVLLALCTVSLVAALRRGRAK